MCVLKMPYTLTWSIHLSIHPSVSSVHYAYTNHNLIYMHQQIRPTVLILWQCSVDPKFDEQMDQQVGSACWIDCKYMIKL